MLFKHLWSCPHRTDRISELPEDILHRILYFLSQEDAVRTSVLSKSWRYNWRCRPNLDFSDDTFKGSKHDFISLVDSNLQRYRDRNLSLEEFRLSISAHDDSSHHESFRLLEKWIPLVAIMGVKKFCLSFRSRYYTDGGVDVKQLPHVVFGAEPLQDLHLVRFLVDRKAIQRMVPFNHLRALRLEDVSIEDEVFQQIISSCPLMIETVDLKSCRGLRNVKVKDLRNLKSFSFSGCTSAAEHESCSIEIHPLSLQTINIFKGSVRLEKGAEFRNLKRIYMSHVKSSWDHLSSCKFPSLDHFTLLNSYGLEETKLFIDAPNIRDFVYFGNSIPSISFAKTTSRLWCSFIYLEYRPSNDASSWFFKLNELLKSLSQSSIYLTTYGYSTNDDDGIIQENVRVAQDVDGRRADDKPVDVASLRLVCLSSSCFPSFLNRAFRICRPRIIVEYPEWKIDDIERVWNFLMERGSGEKDDRQSGHDRLWLRDLEGVRMEISERDRVGRRPITLSELRNYRETGYDSIRFALKWRESPEFEGVGMDDSLVLYNVLWFIFLFFVVCIWNHSVVDVYDGGMFWFALKLRDEIQLYILYSLRYGTA